MFLMMPVNGQNKLAHMDFTPTDSFKKCRIPFFAPDKGGRDKAWDFSKNIALDESSQVMLMKNSAGVMSVTESGETSYYHTTEDSLYLLGSESPMEKREYIGKKLSRKLPAEYGDSITTAFRCDGVYCGNHPFREMGTTTVKVDAVGKIVLSDCETIEDVRRVHTIDVYSVCMNLDSAALDTAMLTQVIDERYEWYAPDSQYPIIENITSTTYQNMDVVGTTRKAYCNLPDDETEDYMTPEAEDETNGQDTSPNEEPQAPDIFHYSIEKRGNAIQLNYSLDEESAITAIVANHMGWLCKSRHWTQEAGLGYSVQIDCSGLRPGIYILYINVNGKVNSEKVTL